MQSQKEVLSQNDKRVTGLDRRMTSLFLNRTSRREEQSNPQSTEANMLQSLGGTERHNNLHSPSLWRCPSLKGKGQGNVGSILQQMSHTMCIIQYASSNNY